MRFALGAGDRYLTPTLGYAQGLAAGGTFVKAMGLPLCKTLLSCGEPTGNTAAH